MLDFCNFCSAARVLADAKRREKQVLMRKRENGGTDLFLLPQDYDMEKLKTWEPPKGGSHHGCNEWRQHHIVWYSEILDKCTCDRIRPTNNNPKDRWRYR